MIFDNPLFAIFGILPALNIILFLFKFKQIFIDKALLIFLASAIIASAKSILFLNVTNMGIFLFPFIALASVILLNKTKHNLTYSIFHHKNYKLETPKGYIYTFKKDGKPIKYVSDFIINNTKTEDKVVVLPEGSFINFITNRGGDNFYYPRDKRAVEGGHLRGLFGQRKGGAFEPHFEAVRQRSKIYGEKK